MVGIANPAAMLPIAWAGIFGIFAVEMLAVHYIAVRSNESTFRHEYGEST